MTARIIPFPRSLKGRTKREARIICRAAELSGWSSIEDVPERAMRRYREIARIIADAVEKAPLAKS